MSLIPPMTLSPLGEAWTKHCEGLSLTPYPDNGKCSAGWGHWGAPCETDITEAQAEAWWEEDKARVELAINDQVEVDLAQCQFDALFDFVYNEGTGAFASSTLLRELNEGNKVDVPTQLRRWVYANGRINSGLAERREGEIVLWTGANPLQSCRSSRVVLSGRLHPFNGGPQPTTNAPFVRKVVKKLILPSE